MCGICGVWKFNGVVEESVLRKMNDTLKHRGPDDEGFFLNQDKSVGLAQKRLSILDLSSLGRQPMQAEHCWVTFNGEVYNFDEIRSELKGCGYSFLGGSDTEVILKSYLKWGIESIKRFRGMFAFSLWDEKLQKMFLVRDRAGIKPLYYYWDGQLLVFASELKAILQHPEVKKELNLEALSLFLQMGCVPAPYSIFQNISKLEAGHYLVFDKLQGVQKQKYWDVANYYLEKNETPSLLEAQERLEEILLESFKLRMVSDVEVGMFLSGGIDSSTVASLLTKKLGFSNLKTFTIGFEEKGYNEAEYAKKIAQHLGTDHHELYCATKDAVDVIPQLSEIYDEPFGDSSAIPTYLLAKFARSLVKVSLSADGGDETFAGYDRYWAIDKIYKQFQLYPKGVLKMGAKVFRGLPFNKIFNIYQGLVGVSTGATKLSKQLGKLQRKADRLDNLMAHPQEIVSFYQLLGYGFWKYHEVKELLIEGKATDVFNYLGKTLNKTNYQSLDNISQMQLLDYKTYLPDDILVKVDRATMAWGLEGRDPLLDHKIIEYTASLPLEYKLHKGTTKYLLRRILYKYVPQEYLDRPKQGFSIPLEKWLRGDLRYLLDEYLSESRIKQGGIFNWAVIKAEKGKFLQNKIDYTDHLWLLIVFEMWCERWYH